MSEVDMWDVSSVQEMSRADVDLSVPVVQARPRTKRRAVDMSQYVFFGTVASALVGLVDIMVAFARTADTPETIARPIAASLGIGILVPFGLLLSLAPAVLSRHVSLTGLYATLRKPAVTAGTLLIALFGSLAIIYVGYRRGILVDALDLRGPALLLLFPSVLALGVIPRSFQGQNYAKPAAVLIGVLLVTAVTALKFVGKSKDLPPLLQNGTALVSPVFNGVRRMFDGDNDGFARAFCNTDCDCDDADPDRNPAAIETPGNHIDEDCSGVDLPLPKPASRAPLSSTSSIAYPKAFKPPMNIVLITIDTLRADRLHVYGHDRETSPNLDRFAKENVYFPEVRSQGPSTRHVFPVFLTGRYFPTVHQQKGQKWWTLLDDNTTFAEILKQHGYQTAAVLPYFRFKEHSGFQQGFDTWETVLDEGMDATWSPTGEAVANRGAELLDQLSKTGSPWLLWLHFFDPHASYVRHDDQPSFGNARADLYDGEVFYVDRQLGRFFEVLRKTGDWDTAAVIVTSDHGEGIGVPGDHDINYHGFSLYDSETRIPFMMKAPGLSPRSPKQSVALVDLPPTILAFAGIETPKNMHGYSLVPYALGSTEPRPPFLMHLPETKAWEAVVEWPYKLIWEKQANRYQLFNLASDPRERTNLVETEPKLAARLKDLLKLENYSLETAKTASNP